MFDDPTFRWVFLAAVAVGVAVLFWWQDHDGIRSAWEYRRRIRTRERLTGEEFYRRFYAGSGIPAELVVAVRDFHAAYWGEDPELLRPEDDLFAVNAGADCAGWVAELRARFGVEVPESLPPELRAALPRLDQTFDTVLRCIHVLQAQQGRPNHPLQQTGGA
jgi:hypothetical protein